MKADFLIVGQGLAGTLLGFELLQAGQQVLFIDSADYKKASEVAAGLVNPVVFKRLAKSWLVDELFPVMTDTYSRLEILLGQKFFFPMKIQKVFGAGDAEFWQKKAAENKLGAYLNHLPDYSSYDRLKLAYGCGWVEKGGRVDLRGLIAAFREYLGQNGLLFAETFDFKLLNTDGKQMSYKNIEASKIIFCEGHRGSQNPFFKDVKYKHTKGEVLDLTIAGYQSDHILNKSVFLMPAGEERFRLGATYNWDELDEQPTDAAKSELTGKLEQVFSGDFVVTGHQTGIRPTTHDRRPVVGLHPDYPGIGIFNGLGAKGCLVGPFVAARFAACLTGKPDTLHPETDLGRYYPGKTDNSRRAGSSDGQ
ncbi:NAD(P)/FAD-dependent oxidoreductase [Gaoshiqia sp. Z1-71]|uniref:NAD(P)/FAD-dependent oxidoreductase n=1 Tax=Gaoshiqia hydrogeniformans TaxID=3290090 RepID=UPI003BF8820D